MQFYYDKIEYEMNSLPFEVLHLIMLRTDYKSIHAISCSAWLYDKLFKNIDWKEYLFYRLCSLYHIYYKTIKIDRMFIKQHLTALLDVTYKDVHERFTFFYPQIMKWDLLDIYKDISNESNGNSIIFVINNAEIKIWDEIYIYEKNNWLQMQNDREDLDTVEQELLHWVNGKQLWYATPCTAWGFGVAKDVSYDKYPIRVRKILLEKEICEVQLIKNQVKLHSIKIEIKNE